jgi:hypothetical protein
MIGGGGGERARLWQLLGWITALGVSPTAFVVAARTPGKPVATVSTKAALKETVGATEGGNDEGRSAPSPTADPCHERFLRPIQRLAGNPAPGPKTPAACPKADTWCPEVVQAKEALKQKYGKDLEIETLIATIPDPLDSGLGYQYDTHLESLQLAIETEVRDDSGVSSFHRDRSWLPWDTRGITGEADRGSLVCRERVPGLVIFRRSGTTPGFLFLLLVGESPKFGVHMQAMAAALAIEKVLAVRDSPIRIQGPTFSGSAFSLRYALAAKGGSERPISIISGTASGPDVPHQLRKLANTTYRATTLPQRALECAFLNLAARLGVEEDDVPARTGSERLLDGVAVLRESGTEFGRALSAFSEGDDDAASNCNFAPEVHLAFPFHVSALRDAYEDLDHADAIQVRDPSIARHTALDVSLRERGRALDMPVEASSKTIYAQDIALSHILSEISREGIRYVAIDATDVADAIFLARKIRDVAPDVRLAFLAADALLMHPAFSRDLLGSFVLSPYPFLGADDFSPRASAGDVRMVPHSHASFESSQAEGVFNAALALRGVRAPNLKEYSLVRVHAAPGADALPLWISTIGRGGLVPLAVRPVLDCDQTIYDGPEGKPSLCENGRPAASRAADWRRFLAMPSPELHVDPDVIPPRIWHFTFAALAILIFVDRRVLRRTRLSMRPAPDPMNLARGGDANVEMFLGRTKWQLYACVRQGSLTMALLYMTAVYALAYWTYPRGLASLRAFTSFAILLTCAFAVAGSAHIFAAFYGDYRILRRQALPTLPSLARSMRTPGDLDTAVDRWIGDIGHRLQRWLGFLHPLDRRRAIYTSFAQLRCRAWLVSLAAAGLMIGLGLVAVDNIDGFDSLSHHHPPPALTLFVLRTLPLTNGVSFAAPVLLCLMGMHIWAHGRNARLFSAHRLATLTPSDRVADGVSTPMHSILCDESDDNDFATQERSVLEAIWRPATGPGYFVSVAVVVFLPVILFLLKPPGTLEPAWETKLLAALLGLGAILVCTTLVQALHFWRALTGLLKRIAAHPIADAFVGLPDFLRQSVDTQISGFSWRMDDLLKMIRVARLCPNLGGARGLDLQRNLAAAADAAERDAGFLRHLRSGKMRPADGVKATRSDFLVHPERLAEVESTLGCTLVEVATGIAAVTRTPVEKNDSIRAARVFVAAVLTLLLNRHVRQFKYFIYTSTGCGILVLAATVSYPFEPHRLFLSSVWVMMGAVVLASLGLFVTLDRDELMSRISHSDPGKITDSGSLAKRVLIWAVAPLVAVAAAQYPQLANSLASWLEPVLTSLR